jgi:ribosomal protein S18 acetylase RimI-like enzyme
MVSNTNTSDWTIRSVQADDYAQWQACYRLYAEFYATPINDNTLQQTWRWLLDPAYPLAGLVAVSTTGSIVGIAHYRPYPEPLLGQEACYLDDLFVLSASRKQGIGRALIAHLNTIAQQRGWPFVRWITAFDNTTARALYDQLARASAWVTYDLPANRAA